MIFRKGEECSQKPVQLLINVIKVVRSVLLRTLKPLPKSKSNAYHPQKISLKWCSYLFADILSQNFQKAPGVLDYLLQVPFRTANRRKSLCELFLNFNDINNTLKAACVFFAAKMGFVKLGLRITKQRWEWNWNMDTKMLRNMIWAKNYRLPNGEELLLNNSPWPYRLLTIS